MSAPVAVGVVGLGAMGGRIARRLQLAGHSLVVCDREPSLADALLADGARWATTPRAVADAATVVFASLPRPDVVELVALGEEGLSRGTAIDTFVDLSTTGPAVAARVAAKLRERDVATVDAPVSGGPAGAEAGRLTMMVAGEAGDVERVRPLLESFAARLFVVGPRPGQGQAAKVINNLMSACAIAITAEAMALGVREGLDPQTLLDVINNSSGANNAASDKFPKQVLTRRFDHGFRLELMAKDVRLALDEARRQHVPMLLGATVGELWSLAESEAPGEDCTAIVQMIERWSDTVIAATAPAQL